MGFQTITISKLWILAHLHTVLTNDVEFNNFRRIKPPLPTTLTSILVTRAPTLVQCCLKCKTNQSCSFIKWTNAKSTCQILANAKENDTSAALDNTGEYWKKMEETCTANVDKRYNTECMLEKTKKSAQWQCSCLKTLCPRLPRKCSGGKRFWVHTRGPESKDYATMKMKRDPQSINKVTLCFWFIEFSLSARKCFPVLYNEISDTDCHDFGFYFDQISSTNQRIIQVHFLGVKVSVEARMILGTPHHFCLTWSSLQGRAEIFVDGSLIKSLTGVKVNKTVLTNGTLVIGKRFNPLKRSYGLRCLSYYSKHNFNGTVSDVYFWRDALTKDEVETLYNQCEISKKHMLLTSWTMKNVNLRYDAKLEGYC